MSSHEHSRRAAGSFPTCTVPNHTRRWGSVALVLLGCLLGAPEVRAATIITFGTLPDGSSSFDDYALPINDAYVVDGVSVSFGFDTDGDFVADSTARIEARGTDGTDAFLYDSDHMGNADTEAPGFELQLGSHLLAGVMGASLPLTSLIISYDSATAVTGASGEIWDIDTGAGTERFKVEAFDAFGALLLSVDSPEPTGLELDGKPWAFSLDTSGIGAIDTVRISFTGTKTLAGFAFDNFAAAPLVVPEPSTGLCVGLGLFVIATLDRETILRILRGT
jgi:hypothetical protein